MIFLIGFNILVGEEIICSFLKDPLPELKCRNNKVIDVDVMKVGYVDYGTSCDDTERRVRDGEELSHCFEDLPFGL